MTIRCNTPSEAEFEKLTNCSLGVLCIGLDWDFFWQNIIQFLAVEHDLREPETKVWIIGGSTEEPRLAVDIFVQEGRKRRTYNMSYFSLGGVPFVTPLKGLVRPNETVPKCLYQILPLEKKPVLREMEF
jgi:hypothetical protein